MTRSWKLALLALALAALACSSGGRGPAEPAAEIPAVEATQPSAENAPPTEAPAEQASPVPTATSAPPTEALAETPTEEPTPTAQVLPADPVQIEASGASGDTLAQAWEEARALPVNIPFAISVPESEIETQVNAAIAASDNSGSIGQVDVTIAGGQMSMTWPFTFTVNGQSRTASALTVYAVTVDGAGKLLVTLVTAQLSGVLGSITLPPETLAVMNQSISQALTQADEETARDVVFTSVTLEGGVMVMAGYIPPE